MTLTKAPINAGSQSSTAGTDNSNNAPMGVSDSGAAGGEVLGTGQINGNGQVSNDKRVKEIDRNGHNIVLQADSGTELSSLNDQAGEGHSGAVPAVSDNNISDLQRQHQNGYHQQQQNGAVDGGKRRSGHVKFFNSIKGFGFIIPDDPNELNANGVNEIFVHHTAIKNQGGFKSLGEGEQVEYSLVNGLKGLQASQVTGPGGKPVQGDPQATRPFGLNQYGKHGHNYKSGMQQKGMNNFYAYGMYPPAPYFPVPIADGMNMNVQDGIDPKAGSRQASMPIPAIPQTPYYPPYPYVLPPYYPPAQAMMYPPQANGGRMRESGHSQATSSEDGEYGANTVVGHQSNGHENSPAGDGANQVLQKDQQQTFE
ncbi:hypothetical protein MP228_002865 [Amoeboaphelidium protococcarum]|nr:hypothetical protein MP228_002865 [Amoeboaphelidium protococcarum]